MARLPVPGADDNTWGDILNDYLLQSHTAIGGLKASAVDAVVSDATASEPGVIQLAGDLGGTALAPTVPGLSGKADDVSVVHVTGNETIDGIKTFSSAPVVPDNSFPQAKVQNLTSDLAARQPLDTDLTAIAALAPADDDLMQRKSGVWSARSPTQVKTDMALGNVDNTSDLNKPISTATQTALNSKASSSHTHTASEVTDFDAEVSNNTDVAANTAARHTHANSAVLNATTASFTTADETKLDGIAAGADVTNTASVTAAGAVMNSQVDADIKTLALPANTTISIFGASLVDDATAAAARTTLGVDAAGTDNSVNVTIIGQDYLTLAGQAITARLIDLDNLSATGTPSSSTFLRGDNTWAAPAAGAPGGATTQVQFNDAGTFGGDAGLTYNKTTNVVSINSGGITVPGVGASSEHFGAGATAAGSNGTALGTNAAADAPDSTAIGNGATANVTSGGVALGQGAVSGAQNALAIGSIATATGSNSFAFGRAANASSSNAIAMGSGSSASGSTSIAMLGTAAGNSGIAIGTGAVASNTWSLAIGNTANSGHLGSIALGVTATTTAAGQFVAGNPNGPVTDVYFGKGVANAAPGAYTIRGTGGSGTNIAGGNIAVQGGVPTGTGLYGNVLLQSGGGNVGIGTATPNANASLDVVSTTKPFMPPRMTTTQRDAVASPTAGMMIYNITSGSIDYYNGTAWKQIVGV